MTDINSLNVKSIFDSVNENSPLIEVYKEVRENELLISKAKNTNKLRVELLSIYLETHNDDYTLSSGKELTPEQPPKETETPKEPEVPKEPEEPTPNEPPKLDLPKIEIEPLPETPEFEEPSDFSTFRDNLVKYIKGEETNSEYPNIKKEYDSLFKNVGVIKSRDFVTEIIGTQSFDELKELYNSLIDNTQRAFINTINSSLKRNNHTVKGLEGENAYTRYMRDIEEDNHVVRDTRKHVFYDFNSIELDYNAVAYCSNRVGENLNRVYDGFQSEYYDLHQYSVEVINILDTINLNNFYDFLKNEDVSNYLSKALQAQSLPTISEYREMIPQIFSMLPEDAEQSDKDKEQEFLKILDSYVTMEQGTQLMTDIIEISSKYGLG